MNEIIPILAAYGLPGAVILVLAWLLFKLIDRGFTFQVPPRRGGR